MAFSLRTDKIVLAMRAFDGLMPNAPQRWIATLLVSTVAACAEPGATANPGAPSAAPRTAATPRRVAPVTEASELPRPPPPEARKDPSPAPDPTVTAAPEPAFPGKEAVSITDLVDELQQVAVAMESSDAVRTDYLAFIEEHKLPDGPALFTDYVRVKLAFEMTRDGGPWGLRWTITNRAPNSEAIWNQWNGLAQDAEVLPDVTADAECDELSALFAFIVRRLGVDHVGLFWPEWNHVVAVWTVRGKSGDTRIVVPTSQIFLPSGASLGTRGFNAKKQKTIYTYKRKDRRGVHTIPAPLAEFFVAQAKRYATLPQAKLQQLRDVRAARVGGS